MLHIKYWMLFIQTCIILLLFSCKRHTHITYNNQPEKIYLSAKHALNNSNYKYAIKKLEMLHKKYPFNLYSNQSYIDLIYAYYKSMNFTETNNIINTYITVNPNHPNLDYILYIQGLIHMDLDKKNILDNFFNLKHSEKNPQYAHEAFHIFSQLISKYPDSLYSPDAKKRLVYLKNRISEHELSIIQYYFSKEAYIAVISRVENMLHNLPDTQATYQSLFYMHQAYQKLNIQDQANIIQKIISYNTH